MVLVTTTQSCLRSILKQNFQSPEPQHPVTRSAEIERKEFFSIFNKIKGVKWKTGAELECSRRRGARAQPHVSTAALHRDSSNIQSTIWDLCWTERGWPRKFLCRENRNLIQNVHISIQTKPIFFNYSVSTSNLCIKFYSYLTPH